MILRNKKTGKFETITHEMWDKLKSLDMQRKFEVVDNTDISVMDVAIPQEVQDFMASLSEPIQKQEETPAEPIEKQKEPSDIVTDTISENELDVSYDDEGDYKPKKRTKKQKHE
jgi:hypothetical protein